jgi:hypothetical protein
MISLQVWVIIFLQVSSTNLYGIVKTQSAKLLRVSWKSTLPLQFVAITGRYILPHCLKDIHAIALASMQRNITILIIVNEVHYYQFSELLDTSNTSNIF